MNDVQLAQEIVRTMMERDAFSQWLGIKVLEVAPGNITLQMTVRPEMVNGFGVVHGGVTFSFADSALAFASNSFGRISMSIENNIAYPAPVHVGDILTAKSEQLSLTNSLAVFDVTVSKQDGQRVGLFRGTVYRTKKEFE
jgi:acyl-CoA thioesterase